MFPMSLERGPVAENIRRIHFIQRWRDLVGLIVAEILECPPPFVGGVVSRRKGLAGRLERMKIAETQRHPVRCQISGIRLIPRSSFALAVPGVAVCH